MAFERRSSYVPQRVGMSPDGSGSGMAFVVAWEREEAARAASSALAMVETAERLLDRDLEASDYAGVAASRE